MPLPAAGSAWAQLPRTPPARAGMERHVSSHMRASARVHECAYWPPNPLEGIQAKSWHASFCLHPQHTFAFKFSAEEGWPGAKLWLPPYPHEDVSLHMPCAKETRFASRQLLQGFKEPQTQQAHHTF